MVEEAARKAETTSALQNDEAYVRSMEQLFREGTGRAGSFALGGPGAAAAPRIGRKLSGVEFEDSAPPPPKDIKPPIESINISYE